MTSSRTDPTGHGKSRPIPSDIQTLINIALISPPGEIFKTEIADITAVTRVISQCLEGLLLGNSWHCDDDLIQCVAVAKMHMSEINILT